MSQALLSDRRIDSSVAEVVEDRRNPQFTYREAQKEIARIIRETGSILKISAISDTVIGQEPSNSVQIFLQVGNTYRTTPKEKKVKGADGTICISYAPNFFQATIIGSSMNFAVQAMKRAYLNWKVGE